ncbi:TraU family protein (plasmid) [Vibrio alginolyticus]
MSARLNACLLLAGVLSTPLTFAGITTPKVIASAACPDCLDYQVIGTCLWMTCTPIGCTTKTSIKVKHRLPDFVVMSYPETGNAPWKATQWMSPDNRFAKNGGHTTGRSVQGLDNPSLRFYNTDVIGHPGGKTVYSLLAGMGYSLSSEAKPFMPHYLSSLDSLGWRYNLPDALSIDGLNPFGETLRNFGDVYPRGGFVLQTHPYKAAALTAFGLTSGDTQRTKPGVQPVCAHAPCRLLCRQVRSKPITKRRPFRCFIPTPSTRRTSGHAMTIRSVPSTRIPTK